MANFVKIIVGKREKSLKLGVTKQRMTPETPVTVGQLGLITKVEPSGFGQGYAIVVNWGDDVFSAYDDWVDFSVDTRLH